MNNLEDYLDKYEGKTIDNLKNYIELGYEDELIFKHHLNFMLNNLYNIKIVESKRKRLNQKEFREQILEKFNNKCIITGEDCIDELDAAHIKEVKDEGDYDIDNGLLLRKNIHSTYDKNHWTINPETLKIEIINKCKNVGSIKDYEGKQINLQLNNDLKSNLIERYEKFNKN